MMRGTRLLAALLCLCLLAGCKVSESAGECYAEEPSGVEAPSGTAGTTPVGVTFRVIRERDGSLLLAKDEGERWDVFTMSLKDKPLTLNGKPFDLSGPGAYQDLPGRHLEGALVEIAYGSVQETYPAQLGEVTAVNILTAGFDDRCALYRKVLDDLWDTDPGLNGEITTVSVDLSQTGLTPGEREAVAMTFSWDHAIPDYLTLSYAELKEEGYLDCADGNCDGIPHWEDGVLLSITEKADGAAAFDAEKWRSALGAYIFADCTAVRDGDGHWDGYTVGAEAIA